MSNTAGGVIIYGVETERDERGNDTGVASAIVGLPSINADKEKQRLTSMLHDGISPSLAAHSSIHDITLASAVGPVIVLGIGQSLARPHMITFDRSYRFWRRSDVGKYQPDIVELRSLFLETASWVE